MNQNCLRGHLDTDIALETKTTRTSQRFNGFPCRRKASESTLWTVDEEPLLDALWQENHAAARRLLPLVRDLEYTGARGMTALQICASRGDAVFLETLLRRGAAVDGTRSGHWTALQLAAHGGHCDAVTTLVKHGATMNHPFPWTSPLHIAISQGHASAVYLLLDLGADILAIDQNGANVLHSAVQACCCKTNSGDCPHIEALQEILLFARKNGLTIKQLEEATRHQDSILTSCLDVDNLGLLQILIKHGADLEATNEFGETVLHRAAWHGNAAAVECLLRNGANIEARDGCGYTPLHNAIVRNFPAICKALLIRKANVNAFTETLKNPGEYKRAKMVMRTRQRFSAVQLAILHANAEIVKLLVKKGADCAVTTLYEKYGVLQLAHKMWPSYKLEVMDRYLAPVAGDIHSMLNYDCAKKPKHIMAMAIQARDQFLAKAISINPLVNPTEALTMLFDAKVTYWDIFQMCDTVNTLIGRGACPNSPVGSGRPTPLIWAIQNGDFETTKMILKAGAHVDASVAYDHYGTRISCALAAVLRPTDRRSVGKKLALLLAADVSLAAFWRSGAAITCSARELELLADAAKTPLSLKQCARKTIRNSLCHATSIEALPFPSVIKTYLRLPELDDITLSDFEKLQEISQ